MKKISVLYLLSIFLGASSPASAQGVSKCFRADWLQGERVVNMTINGSEVTGTFEVKSGSGEDAPAAAIYNFRGRLTGNSLRVAFAGNKMPDVSPSEMKSLIWTLVRRRGQESLRIQFSGRNYNTNKFETTFADFESCGGATAAGYAALAGSAKRVQFAAGTNSASFPVLFKTKSERKSFLLNMKAGQRLEVEAIGCSITFYYPDKTEGAEPAIDTWSTDALTQSGDYLFVMSPAPQPGKRTINFKVTN